MIYSTSSPFSYTKPQPPAKFGLGQEVHTQHGKGHVRARKHNGSGWEYGLEIVGLTKGGNIWFTEGSIA